MNQTQLQFEPAEQLRDESLKQVADNSQPWFDRAIEAAEEICKTYKGRTCTGEKMRLYLTAKVGEPHHHNAWGSVIRCLVKGGSLVPTGEWEKMRTPRSHARQTPVYRMGG